MNHREHRLQAWADRFIDRVVLPPMFTTALDVAAANMASIGRRATLQARGAVFGLPDCLVAQGDGQDIETVAWIEYKRGTGLTARQKATHASLQRVGFHVYTASSIADVFDALRLAGFRLHGNAANIAAEMEERLLASDRKAKPTAPRKSRARPTPQKVAQYRAAGVLV